MEANAPQTLYVTSAAPADLTGFITFQQKTEGLGKNQQGYKYVGDSPRQAIVVTKSTFAEPKAPLTAAQRRENRKNAPKLTLAEQRAKLAARLAALDTKIAQPELAGATA